MEAAQLARLRELARRTAWKRQNYTTREFEDAAQEAWIAGWQAAKRHPDKPEGYVQRAMTNRVIDFATGSRPLGSERPNGGYRKGPKLVHADPVPLHALPEDFHPPAHTPDTLLWAENLLSEPLDKVVVQAVVSGTELKSLSLSLGKGKSWATQRWHNNIRPRLKEAWEDANIV